MAISYKKMCVELLEAISTFSEDDSAKINAKFTNSTSCIYDKMSVEFSTSEGEHTIEKTEQGWEHTVLKARSGSEITDVI
jgi:hypothetical protein|nr:MAG TPA: hypothetical protein [Caudoviricetes sp.]